MAGEEELSQLTAGELQAVPQLLASSEALQIAFVILAVGIISIVIAYRKFSSWVRSQRFYYEKPHIARFLRSVMLPFFAIALITAVNVYVQAGILTGEGGAAAESTPAGALTAGDAFAKILNTFNILVIGYAVSHLIPIILTKHERYLQERGDFEQWFDMRGFVDDEDGLFHRLYKWIPPKDAPEAMDQDEYEAMLKTEEGTKRLEQFRTAQGNPIGGYEKRVKSPFEDWKRSERAKYSRYYDGCISGNNETGLKLRPGAKPEEIYPIDTWREEKRLNGYEKVVPSARPPGHAEKKRKGIPKSIKQLLPVGLFAATILGVLGWWGIDLFVLATATGGFSIGLGLALQEAMKNYFAYLRIRKDKIVVEGDRIQMESGYNGYVHKITPLVTYVMDPLYESVAIVPTNSLVSAQIINYTKENRLVPAVVNVGVSYLNNPKQVAAILVKVGKRAMKEIVDEKDNHLVRQARCPYLDENSPSCGCDKDLHVELTQPVVRFDSFNDSSLDFSMWVYVRDYGAQFKTKTDMRVMIYEEFKKYDIRIPWPIRTIYQGDEKREGAEIGSLDKERQGVIDEHGTGDLRRGGDDE